MAYTKRNGKKPNEFASRSAHGYVIKDASVKEFLSSCVLPKHSRDISFDGPQFVTYELPTKNPIHHIVAIDGGYTELSVKKEFPSAVVCFFQIGALIFSVEDLLCLEEKPFIDPEDMARLKQIQRFELTLPIRNVILKNQITLTNSVRRAIYNFFCKKPETLIDSLKWFLFSEYNLKKSNIWILSNCPNCRNKKDVELDVRTMSKDYTFKCPNCGGIIYLTDVFRLHEAIDDEFGAGGIPGYVITTIEQIILVHLIRLILETKPALLNHVLFVKDGPLAFFGQTANMHKPMRKLIEYLFDKHNLYLVGLEKSGSFVEHADEIANRLDNGTALILDNDYIYKYIVPGKADPSNPYGRTTYYGSKLIFKTLHEGIHVATIPTPEIIPYPKKSDLRNLNIILANIEMLKCDMYDNALLPIALANKLVSLANHPSSKILQRFAKDSLSSTQDS